MVNWLQAVVAPQRGQQHGARFTTSETSKGAFLIGSGKVERPALLGQQWKTEAHCVCVCVYTVSCSVMYCGRDVGSRKFVLTEQNPPAWMSHEGMVGASTM